MVVLVPLAHQPGCKAAQRHAMHGPAFGAAKRNLPDTITIGQRQYAVIHLLEPCRQQPVAPYELGRFAAPRSQQQSQHHVIHGIAVAAALIP